MYNKGQITQLFNRGIKYITDMIIFNNILVFKHNIKFTIRKPHEVNKLTIFYFKHNFHYKKFNMLTFCISHKLKTFTNTFNC